MAQKIVTPTIVTVTTAATAVQVSSSDTPISSITFQGHESNTGVVYVGDSAVSATKGISLAANAQITIYGTDARASAQEFVLSDFWCDTATNGNKVRVLYQKVR